MTLKDYISPNNFFVLFIIVTHLCFYVCIEKISQDSHHLEIFIRHTHLFTLRGSKYNLLDIKFAGSSSDNDVKLLVLTFGGIHENPLPSA